MITESQIKAAIKNAPNTRGGRIELKENGERGAGRLTMMVRANKNRVSTEWYALYYRLGKRTLSKVGNYPTVSLADARKKFREEYAPAISAGAELSSKTARRAHARESGKTVKDLFAAYVAELRAQKRVSVDSVEQYLNKALEFIGANRPAADVEPEHVLPYLQEIHGRGSITRAGLARAWVSAAFSFGMKSAHDYTKVEATANWGIKVNPVAAIKADPNAHKVRDRFLSPEELGAIWTWTADRQQASPLMSAIQLLYACGQRVEEILRIVKVGAAASLNPDIGWGEFAPDEKIIFWSKTKNGLPHAIPLPDQAVEILNALTPNRHGLYFPSREEPAVPAVRDSVGQNVRRFIADTGTAHFIPRDARRTWKTLAGRAGISKEMRDRLQNHARGGDVSSRHYDRYDYLLEKRAAMAKWSAYLDRIIVGTASEEPALTTLVSMVAAADGAAV
jgi:integrase